MYIWIIWIIRFRFIFTNVLYNFLCECVINHCGEKCERKKTCKHYYYYIISWMMIHHIFYCVCVCVCVLFSNELWKFFFVCLFHHNFSWKRRLFCFCWPENKNPIWEKKLWFVCHFVYGWLLLLSLLFESNEMNEETRTKKKFLLLQQNNRKIIVYKRIQ